MRVCTALASLHDWKGRVGLVGDAELDAAPNEPGAQYDEGDDEAGMDEDEDMFGSGDETDPTPPNKSKPREGPDGGAVTEAAVPMLVKAEKERELRRLMALMARGEPTS